MAHCCLARLLGVSKLLAAELSRDHPSVSALELLVCSVPRHIIAMLAFISLFGVHSSILEGTCSKEMGSHG